jgi:predicted transposase/invertase (TIGR01784 family)
MAKKKQPSPEKMMTTIQSVNPRVDIAFKKIFGVEENKDLLISLINSIVSQEDQIKDVRILNPYNLQNFKKDKLSILDIKAEGHNKKRYHIEIQISDEGDYDKRALHNWAKVYAEQLASSNDYKLLNKTIGIHILNFLSIPGSAKYHNVFHLKEKDAGFRFFSDMELHTIELRKFEEKKKKSSKQTLDRTEELRNLLSKIKTALDIWVAFLTRHDLLDKSKLPSEIDNPSLRKALNVIEVMNLSPEEREAYEGHLNWLRMEVSTVNKVQAEATEKGIEMGIEIGIEMGMEKGITQLLFAINMLKQKKPDVEICRESGLSGDDLAKLKHQLS